MHIYRSRQGGWPAAASLALVLALPLTGAASPGSGAEQDAGGAGADGQLTTLPADDQELTLITGDRILVQQDADDRLAVTIDPAERDGHASFETIDDGEQVYVIPSDAAMLIPDVLDRELFNVTKLIEYGYTDGVPVIVTHQDAGTARRSAGMTGASVTATLSSIDAVAATIEPGGAWWTAAQPAEAPARAASGPLAGVEKVWLDELAEVTLDESGPLVGAPEARAAGFDGTGMTIAVLDTGIDDSHPDLAGKVVAAENFTTEPDASDGHGHGTHVAGIAAGTGAASGGAYAGIATGAELINGKVCNSNGHCPNSWVLAGMEWAAPRADVISLSVSTQSGSDGTDVLSQAVNALTAQHDTLFVIAAGNLGFLGDGSVGSPGAADAALTVGAVDKAEQLAFFSSRGPRLGDFAIKPDITAPGVSIVSARAEGTERGPIVDEVYQQISGTSMATPHVSGAAAILLQQDPDRSAAELKAALATTGVPNDSLDVYQQGGGRLDIPAALEAPVRAAPAPLDLGYHRYPHDDAEPAPAEVTYTNRTNDPVTLELTLDVVSSDGDVPTDAMLSLDPSTVVIDAGGTATTTVTLDVRHGGFGLYGGYLMAESAGEAVSRIPVGFFKEPERYDLTVEGIARDGRPAGGTGDNISKIYVLDVHDMTRFREEIRATDFTGGVATLRVPPGTYSVMGLIPTTLGTPFTEGRVMVGDPEVEVTEDTTVVLDARESTPVVIDTPAHETAEPFGVRQFQFWRQAEHEGSLSVSWTFNQEPTFAVPTDPVTIGAFEFNTRTRIGEPPLALELVDPVAQKLRPRAMIGSPPLDDDLRLPLVWVGAGQPEDYEDLDAEGAVALSQRGLGPGNAAKEATARANGAAALVLMNNEAGPYTGSVGNNAEIPTMTISMEEGQLLRDLLDDGAVTLRMWGVSATPYLYDLVLPEQDQIPGELRYVADPAELVTLRNNLHSDAAAHTMGEVRHTWRPWQVTAFSSVAPWPAPQARTEYLTANDTRYRQSIRPECARSGGLICGSSSAGTMFEPITTYEPGEQRDQTWFKSPRRPGVFEGGPHENGQPAFRDGDTLTLALKEWTDAHPGHWGERHASVDTTAFRFFVDGELAAETPRAVGSFPMSPGQAEYRLELDVARDAEWWTTSTATRTAWTLQSQRPSDESEIVPLLLVDYEVELDLLNTALPPDQRRGPNTVDLQVRHQTGADGAAIGGARVWVSYDDGETWRERPVRRLGDGGFRAVLDNRDPEETNGFVALRVEAWDVDANRIEQEVTRAWRLSPR